MKHLLTSLLLLISVVSYTQDNKMNNDKLGAILKEISTDIQGQNGNWQFVVEESLFICITDENANRMRIIAPIIEVKDLDGEQIFKCMEANFHTVLDAKYAISDDVLWSVFIHPLQELTEEQVKSAVYQVFSTAASFGTEYTSGLFSFPKPGEELEREAEEQKKDGTKS